MMPYKRTVLLGASLLCWGTTAFAAEREAADENDHYRIEEVEVPPEAHLEIGGMAFTPDGKLYISTRRGEIWAVASSAKAGGPAERRWSLFAQGLHEALGVLALGNGDLAVAHRPELTRVRDTDGDGRADSFVPLASGWGVNGNYHEYHYGPVRDRAGNLYGTLNLGWENRGVSDSKYRGWTYKVTPKGEFVPFAVGFRSPAGIGISPAGEIFVTDNQGDWMATSPLFHVREKRFYGHPAGLKWEKGYAGPEDPAEIPPETLAKRRTLPAAWFVYGPLGHSPTEPLWDTTKGKFGPFAGDMLVGDQTKSLISRVVLEKVGGEYQGAVFPFRRGFGSGITRMAWDRTGTLWVGGTDRGWGATGGKAYALQTLRFTGKVPFEVRAMSLARKNEGFVLTFTKPVDRASAADASAYTFQHYTYNYWKTYGSPHVGVTPVAVKEARVSADGRQVTLLLPPLEKERVYELKLKGVRAADGSPLLHNAAYYTLNRLRGN
jgi:hypothetical protein